jgi:energy-coupling factor transport system ATP-binding protein
MLASMDLLKLRQRPTSALSVGEQQRVALAATLSPSPPLVILDEPTAGQDWGHLIRVMDFMAELNRAGQTILLITHDRRLVKRYANRVWRLENGRVMSLRR